jgi:multicomponent Na+:H+ antiporter subunit C
MEVVLAIVVGGLYAAGIYLLLRRSLVRLIIGIGLLANGANLLLFTVAGVVRGRPPIVAEGESAVTPPFADPLPQALILTAIVIGFGLLAFTMVLLRRASETLGTGDVDDLRSTDR